MIEAKEILFPATLLVAVVVATALVPAVIEPILFNRKFLVGSCVQKSIEYYNNGSMIDCSCGFQCTSQKPCLIAQIEYSINNTDPAIRFYSNETHGEELLNDRRQQPTTSGIPCTNRGCLADQEANVRRAHVLMKELQTMNNTFLCRVNINRPAGWRVILATAEEEEAAGEGNALYLAIAIPWTIIYLLLLANAIYGHRSMAPVAAPSLKSSVPTTEEAINPSIATTPDSRIDSDSGIQDHVTTSQSQFSTPSAGSRKELVARDEISVDFEGGNAAYRIKR